MKQQQTSLLQALDKRHLDMVMDQDQDLYTMKWILDMHNFTRVTHVTTATTLRARTLSPLTPNISVTLLSCTYCIYVLIVVTPNNKYRNNPLVCIWLNTHINTIGGIFPFHIKY